MKRKTDPTKTLVIRARASREINRRFKKVRTFVRDAVITGGLISNVKVEPRRYTFLRDKAKIEAFNRDLQRMIDQEIMGIADGTIEGSNYWLNVHVGQGYERGAKKARLVAERNIVRLDKLPNYSPFLNPAHLERAELVYTRVFNGMKGICDVMKGQISQELAAGMMKGLNPKTVAKSMVDRVDKIGITRAKLIARTEIVEAHNQASIVEGGVIQKETGVKEQYQWVTSLDGRERPTHHDRHLKVYSKEDALNLIGEPNCRCSISLYIDVKKL